MKLPLRPDSICATAWEGVFSAQFGLLHEEPISDHFHADGGSVYLTGGYEYTLSWDAWRECAFSGCLWCQLLERNCLSKLTERTNKVHVRVGRRLSWVQIASVIVNGYEVRFRLHTAEDDPAATWIKDRSRMPHVEAPHVLPMAKTCIEDCIRDHNKCQAITQYPIGSAPLPTRVIDCSHPDRVRLVETSSSMRGSYIALSYVWGPKSDQAHCTTEANLRSYMKGIDSDLLPQTILDAIYVTRALGIRYLWIDSLCIIQDSTRDMNHDLARMQDVYRHASLTIDVGSAASVTEGFLRDRRPLDSRNWLPFICPRGYDDPLVHEPLTHVPVGHVYWDAAVRDSAALWLNDHTKSDTGSFLSFQPTSHTAGRGWCLQERLLSTRSLVFTFETVQLRCHTLTRNVEGAPHEETHDLPRLPEATFHADPAFVRGSDEWKRIGRVWRDIVCDYSRRSLSNPSDKLIALSGLAGMFAPVLGPDYLAGIWHDSLLQDLLWESDTTSIRLPHYYRAPSWTWASHDGPINYYIEDENYLGLGDTIPLAEVVRCTTALRNETLRFGYVIGGTLVISARFLQCQWISCNEYGRPRIEVEPHYFSALEPDDCLVGNISLDYDDDIAVREMWFIPLIPDTDRNYVVGFVTTRRAKPLDQWHSEHSEEAEREVFRRIGFCRVKLYGLSVESAVVLDMIRTLPAAVIELV